MVEYLSTVTTPEQKIMLGEMQEFFIKAKQDLATHYHRQLIHRDSLIQLNPSELQREVSLLLQNNPFNKPL